MTASAFLFELPTDSSCVDFEELGLRHQGIVRPVVRGYGSYRQGLVEINCRGIYAMLAESSQSYLDPVWFNFESNRPTVTEDWTSGKMIGQSCKGVEGTALSVLVNQEKQVFLSAANILWFLIPLTWKVAFDPDGIKDGCRQLSAVGYR